MSKRWCIRSCAQQRMLLDPTIAVVGDKKPLWLQHSWLQPCELCHVGKAAAVCQIVHNKAWPAEEEHGVCATTNFFAFDWFIAQFMPLRSTRTAGGHLLQAILQNKKSKTPQRATMQSTMLSPSKRANQKPTSPEATWWDMASFCPEHCPNNWPPGLQHSARHEDFVTTLDVVMKDCTLLPLGGQFGGCCLVCSRHPNLSLTDSFEDHRWQKWKTPKWPSIRDREHKFIIAFPNL